MLLTSRSHGFQRPPGLLGIALLGIALGSGCADRDGAPGRATLAPEPASDPRPAAMERPERPDPPSERIRAARSDAPALPAITVRPVPPDGGPEVGPVVRVDRAPAGVQSAEPSVAASPDGELLAAWVDAREDRGRATWRVMTAVSLDGGETWHETVVRPPEATDDPEETEADPMTAYDPRTGFFWVGGLSFRENRNLFVARKDPGVLEPDPSRRTRPEFSGSPDKGLLAAGPDPEDPEGTLLYLTDYFGLQISRDLGATWSEPRGLRAQVGPLPRVGPLGELYIVGWDGDRNVLLQRSFDGGEQIDEPVTVATRREVWGVGSGDRFPGRFRVPPLAYLAVDPVTGTLYCLYSDTREFVETDDGPKSDVDLYFTRSRDRGETWTPPRPIPFGAGAGDQFFPWMEVDPVGRIHLVFYDTRHGQSPTRRPGQRDNQENGYVDVYYAWSADNGESWTEMRLTDSPFETLDTVWEGLDRQFLGDYLGLGITRGRAHPVYAAVVGGDLDILTRSVTFPAPPVGAPIPSPARNLTARPLSPTALRLGWEPPGPGTGVWLQRRGPGEDWQTVRTLPGDAGSLTLSGLEPGSLVAFRIATRTPDGPTAWSAPVTAALAGDPDPSEGPGSPCAPGDLTLCLVDDRFEVDVVWSVRPGTDAEPPSLGRGHARPFDFSDDSGTFWFFDDANIELVVKVLDGRPLNGHFWVFYGALSNVEYWIRVTDTETGERRAYFNPPGELCGSGDTGAFAGTVAPSSTRWAVSPAVEPDPGRSAAATVSSLSLCEPGESVLCLLDRFEVEVTWRDPRSGDSGVGHPIPGTTDSGFFWFFDDTNVELVIKMLDARRVNRNFWFFAGGLSDVEYTIRVTDRFLGRLKVYEHEAFDICGIADTGLL